MAYAPTTYVDGTVLQAATLNGDLTALRVYLHRGIVPGDIANTWIQPRHVQPPVYEPWTGIQHGVTGHIGGQYSAPGLRLQFATKFLSGNGYPSSNTVHKLPQTAFTLDVRRAAKCLFHFSFELECGNDNSTAPYQDAEVERQVWVLPYVGNPANAIGQYSYRAMETRNVPYGMTNVFPIGLTKTMVQGGGAGVKTFTLGYNAPLGRVTAGLAALSTVDRVGVISWGVTIETYYL